MTRGLRSDNHLAAAWAMIGMGGGDE